MAPGTDGPRSRAVPRPLRVLAGILTAASLAVIVVGTLVTGSGPHAGDANARRNNLDPQIIAQVHADLVFLIIGLAVATWFGLRAIKDRVPSAPAASIDAASVRVAWLIGILAAQGAIGLVQYFTNLPVLLVGAHMAGACAVWLATLSVLYATRAQSPPDATVGDTATLAPASAVTGTLVAAQIAPSHP
jgi:cytochrome c oxidase assembly protein subunit 15